MYCLDSTFCIDLANGVPGAFDKARELDQRKERLTLAAPGLTEFLVGAFAQGGKRLARALEFVSQLEVLDVTEPLAVDAARLGGECARRGSSVGSLDLIVAAVAKHHRATILTKDSDFSRIPGIAVETY
jgi:predicted nucleic acid-binding protein